MFFSEFPGSSSCKICPAGTYTSSTRASFCNECPAGTYSGLGADSCKNCPSGTTSKKGSAVCVTQNMQEGKEIISIAVSSIIHNLDAFARKHGIDTAGLGAKLLNMKVDNNGIYHAEFDCWQQHFGYNKFYDLVFDLGTSMALNKEGMFTYNGNVTNEGIAASVKSLVFEQVHNQLLLQYEYTHYTFHHQPYLSTSHPQHLDQ